MVKGGRIATLGVPPAPARGDWSRIVFIGLTIKGIHGREICKTWAKMLALPEAGLPAGRKITYASSVERSEECFAPMDGGRCGKVMLDWSRRDEITPVANPPIRSSPKRR